MEFRAPALEARGGIDREACIPPLRELYEALATLKKYEADPSAKLVYLARHGEGFHSEFVLT